MTALRAVPDDRPRTVLRADVEHEPVPAAPPVTATGLPARVLVARVLVTLALVMVWLAAYLLVFSRLEESRAQHALYEQFRSEVAAGLTPATQPIKVGSPIAAMSVPAAGIADTVIVEGTTGEQLQGGPGHLRGTVLPGQAGVSVLLGRGLTYGAPFGDLVNVHPGDPLTVTTAQGTFHYAVEDLRRKGDPLPPALTGKQGRLTLVTAAGGISGLGASSTLYVDAKLIGKPQPAAGTPVAAGDSELPFGSDTSLPTLVKLVLGLQALALLLMAITWLRNRWRPLAAWVIGAPVVLAALWFTTGAAAQLLPNLV